VLFFSDIRGSRRMSETMSPDAIATLLTEYFTEMWRSCSSTAARSTKFIGDAIMALWGAAHGARGRRRPRDALRRSITLAALRKAQRQVEDEGRPALAIGIGHPTSAEVFAGQRRLGSAARGIP